MGAVVPETNLLTVSVTGSSPGDRSSFLKSMLGIIRILSRRMLLSEVVWKYSRNRIFRRRQMWHSSEVMEEGIPCGWRTDGDDRAAGIDFLSERDNVKSEEEVTEKLDTTVFK